MYQLSKEAAQDIEDILLYSVSNFGMEVAHSYYEGIADSFERIVKYPNICREYDYKIRVLIYKKHAIYYKLQEQSIFIVRVLTTNMLPQKYLKDF